MKYNRILIILCMAISFIISILFATNKLGSKNNNLDVLNNSNAKLAAIEVIKCIFITNEFERFKLLLDSNCMYENNKFNFNRFKMAFEESSKEGWSLSIREIIYFSNNNYPELKKRMFKRFPSKSELWAKDQVPKYINGRLGCCVIAKELQNNKEVDDEVFIFIFKKIDNNYKLIYYGLM